MTYMQHLPIGIDVVFFLGMPSNHDFQTILTAENEDNHDMIVVPYQQGTAADTGGTAHKVYEFFRWAAASNVIRGYSWIAKADSDTMLRLCALM